MIAEKITHYRTSAVNALQAHRAERDERQAFVRLVESRLKRKRDADAARGWPEYERVSVIQYFYTVRVMLGVSAVLAPSMVALVMLGATTAGVSLLPAVALALPLLALLVLLLIFGISLVTDGDLPRHLAVRRTVWMRPGRGARRTSRAKLVCDGDYFVLHASRHTPVLGKPADIRPERRGWVAYELLR